MSEGQVETSIPSKSARLLGLETTCDETAAAVFTDEPTILSSVVASQIQLHRPFGGVVPEIAARAHAEQLLPIIDRALADSATRLNDLAAIAVAYTPGLVGAILVGLAAAKTLALTLDIPLLGVNHLEGHLYACQLAAGRPCFPAVGLVVSGGHTNLFVCQSTTDWEMVGSTIDDAAGEAFDKVAMMLGLGYPGGPRIEQTARHGDPTRYRFPRTYLGDDRVLDFSFSGLKTAVRYAAFGHGGKPGDRALSTHEIADLAASFQAAALDVLADKCRATCRQTGIHRLLVGGGVAANQTLRERLQQMANQEGIDLVIPPLIWCTDNAAMAAVAVERFRCGESDALDLDAVPGLVRRRGNGRSAR